MVNMIKFTVHYGNTSQNLFYYMIKLKPLPVKHDTFKNDKTRKFGNQMQFTGFQS